MITNFNKAYLSAIIFIIIIDILHGDTHFSEFYLQYGGKNQLAQIWNKITSLSHYV